MDAAVDRAIREAIGARRLIRFVLDGFERVAEPHDYGVRGGRTMLLAYQVGGGSKSGRLPDWRWVEVERMRNVRVLDEEFAGNRPAPSGKHSSWDTIYLRVSGKH